MFKFEAILFLATLALCQCLSVVKKNELYGLFDSYKEINYHLFDNVESDDVEPNMREAKRWLDEEVSKSSDRRLIKALELFTSMANMHMCTRESAEILDSNDYATGYEARGLGRYVVATKVLKIIAYYEVKHARECIPKYSAMLRKKYAQVGKSITNRAHKIVQVVKYQSYDAYSKLAHEIIAELAENDPDKKYLGKVPNRRDGHMTLDEAKLRGLYEKYLIVPCTKLADMNEDGWCKAFIFDDQWVRVDFSDHLLGEYTERYKVCKHLIGKDKEKLYKLFRAKANLH